MKLGGVYNYSLLFIKEKARKLYWEKIRNSFAQQGEDLIIDRLLGHRKSGIYVDVGAHDPFKHSNTCRFYRRGWRGINIEPDPVGYKKFVDARPNDINLNIGIGLTGGKTTFYQFDPSTLSTFSKTAKEMFRKQGFKLKKEKKIRSVKLEVVLMKHLVGEKIDFLSIDTEGLDMEVLKSNDWEHYKPKVICIEAIMHGGKKHGQKYKQQKKYLTQKGYVLVYDNVINNIYRLEV